MINAVINLLKPPGMTSHDAVSFVRRTYKQKRVGHSGTLDPAAAGVLPIYLGNATRLVEYGDGFDKEYRAEILFGVTTDTGDDTGKVLSMASVDVVQLENLESTVHEFLGTYEQIPPMYSALKVNGRKLYELAREGKEVERTARQVTIQSIRLIYKDKNRAVIHAACSKGTYIRTLCEDIGQRLGLPATMAFLLRTRVGPFDVSQAVTLEEIAENPQNALLPAATAVSHLPASHFNELESLLLCQGRSIAMRSGDSQSSEPILTRLYKETGIFFGIGEFMIDSGMVKPIKIFADGNEEYVIV